MANHDSIAPPVHAKPRFRAPQPAAGISRETCLLIIDDDRRTSVALSFMLNLRGYDEIRAVRSPARALSIVDNFNPGVVFIDLSLPNCDSLALATQLRNGARQNSRRIIALTSTVEHPSRERARQAGFERFLVKPFEQAEVDKILRLTNDAST